MISWKDRFNKVNEDTKKRIALKEYDQRIDHAIDFLKKINIKNMDGKEILELLMKKFGWDLDDALEYMDAAMQAITKGNANFWANA